ncbi:MAG: trypsin-like serine protease [Gammaproteobacteria bacterium]|nr:trypsin-like serine protease [Gammaproteobacteria bacterium]
MQIISSDQVSEKVNNCRAQLICSLLIFVGLSAVGHPAYSHDRFVQVISSAKPSVVTIKATGKKRLFKSSEQRRREEALGDYAEYYKDDFSNIPDQRFGSGFVVASNNRQSWVLTAAHVVRDSKKITVELAGGDKEAAELVYLDRASDLALLRVDVGMLPVLEISDKQLVEGQSVLGIGAAFGLSVSSSLGIVSALNVRLNTVKVAGMIQTDVSVNPGSSGGALLDSDGEVVGLITKIYSKTGTFAGSSFAVPAAKITSMLEAWLN